MGDRIKRLGIWMGWLILFKSVFYGLLVGIPALVALVRPPEAAQAFRDTLWDNYRGWFNLAPLLLFVAAWRMKRLPGLRDAPEAPVAAAPASLDQGPAVMARRGGGNAAPAPAPARKKPAKPARQPLTLKRWFFSFLWLLGFKAVGVVVLCIGAGIAAVAHPHDAARMTGLAFAQHYGRLTSLGALVTFYLCRSKGILRGLRKPAPIEDVSAVFSGGPAVAVAPAAVPAVRIEAPMSAAPAYSVPAYAVHAHADPVYAEAPSSAPAPAYPPRAPRDAAPMSDEQHASQAIRRLRQRAAAA